MVLPYLNSFHRELGGGDDLLFRRLTVFSVRQDNVTWEIVVPRDARTSGVRALTRVESEGR